MSAPWIRILRGASLAAAAATIAVAGARAAVLTVVIPPWPPKTVTYSQCASFTFNGSTLTCVPTSAPPPPPTDTPPPPTSGTPFAGCPSDALMIDGVWGNNAINTFDYGYFGANILSLRIVVPATANTSGTSSWVEYGTAPFVREAVLSTVACDFSNTYALKKGSGQPARSSPDTISFSFRYTTGPAGMFTVHLQPGNVYYLNVRNRFSDGSLSCPIPSCAMRGGFPQ
jgi:hypothetical protein